MANLRYSVDDMKGVFSVTPTPVKAGFDHWSSSDVVNLEEAERVVNQLIKDGVNGIMINGTLGEMATLTEKEWKAYADVVIKTVDNRVPLFVGATTLNTRDTIARAKFVREQGGHGLFLGRPMWVPMTDVSILRFYQDIAEALPDMSLVVYDNPEAFKGPFSTELYGKLSELPQVVGGKYLAVTERYERDLKAIKGRMRLLNLDVDFYTAHTIAPDQALGCWSGFASGSPVPAIELYNAIRNKDEKRAKELDARIKYTYETFLATTDFKEFSKYNIPLEKERTNESGYMTAGPTLPPYQFCPEEYLEGAREAGRRWKSLTNELKSRVNN